jgi:hypothetical protein
MINADTLKVTATGAAGVVGVGVSQTAAAAVSPEDASNAVGLVLQIIIAVSTLFGIFKRKPKQPNQNQ